MSRRDSVEKTGCVLLFRRVQMKEEGGRERYAWKSDATVTASRTFAGFLDVQVS
jgi:hypothetical protein